MLAVQGEPSPAFFVVLVLGALLWAVGSAMLAKEPETELTDTTTTGHSRS